MFGIGFTELLLISVVAILFLGPDKLPDAMVQIAKFIKSVKNTVGEAKSTLEEEMKISDLKDEALKYKAQLDNASNELKSFKNIDFNDMDDLMDDDHKPSSKKKTPSVQPTAETTSSQVEEKNTLVTFKKNSVNSEETTTPKGDA